MSFMDDKPFLVPAKHWFMRRRCARMPLWKYIQWKQQQIIQSELNQIPGNFPSEFRVFWKEPKGSILSLEESIPQVEYHHKTKALQDSISESYNRWHDILRNAKPTGETDVQECDATKPNSNS